MIARLSLEVFYTITRKLVGAFYVDQKKKDLLPSTLPSEHEQWGFILANGASEDYQLPISMSAAYSATANDAGGICNTISIAPHASTVTVIARKTSDLSYQQTGLYYIVIGS